MFNYYGNTDISNPRGYIETTARLFIFSVIIFHVVNFCFLRPILNMDNTNMDILIMSIVYSIPFSSIYALNLRCVVQTITVTDAETVTDADRFMNNMNLVLSQMSYYPETKFGNCSTFKPSFIGGLLLSRVTIQIEKGAATIIGPKGTVNKLRRQVIF